MTMAQSGKKLLTATVDNIAKTDPSKRFAVIPRGREISDGFRYLSMKDLAQAVDFTSWWIEGIIGPAQSRETLAYMGNHDILYFVFILACQKTGYQVRRLSVTCQGQR